MNSFKIKKDTLPDYLLNNDFSCIFKKNLKYRFRKKSKTILVKLLLQSPENFSSVKKNL